MLKKYFWAVIVFCGLTVSAFTFAEALCINCEVRWIDTEKSNGDLRFATTDDIGSGPCVGTYMTSRSTVTERQRDQMVSVLLAALVSGTKITAEGDSTQCGSLTSITIMKP